MSAAVPLDRVALAEQKRVKSIKHLGGIFPGLAEADVNGAIAAGLSAKAAMDVFRQRLIEECRPIAAVRVGDDRNRASLSAAAADALTIKAGVRLEKPHPRSEEFRGMTVLEVARRFYEHNGINTAGIGRTMLARMILNPNAAPQHVRHAMLAQSTSDFGAVLTTTFNASLRNGYVEGPSTWPQWAKRGTLPDFTQGQRPILSAISTPALTLEGGEVQYSYLDEKNETIQLAKYTRGWRVTWETLVNDRLGAFNGIAEKFGAACRRLEDNEAYRPLTSNQVMTETGNALFHSSHNNLVTGTGNVGAPTVATLSAARVKLARQTGLKGETLNLQPAAILVPVELQTTTEQLIASLSDPAAAHSGTANPSWIRNLAVIGEARLSASSVAAWYLVASPNAVDGIEVAFLEDEPSPVIRNEVDFDTEDMKYAVRHCVGSRALDFRFAVKNPGA